VLDNIYLSLPVFHPNQPRDVDRRPIYTGHGCRLCNCSGSARVTEVAVSSSSRRLRTLRVNEGDRSGRHPIFHATDSRPCSSGGVESTDRPPPPPSACGGRDSPEMPSHHVSLVADDRTVSIARRPTGRSAERVRTARSAMTRARSRWRPGRRMTREAAVTTTTTMSRRSVT